MKTICIYHKNCFDGMCSAWVVSKAVKDIELVSMGYGDKKPNLSDSRVIMVDFSFPRQDLIDLYELTNHRLIVIDHHKTAEEACKGLDFCHFDMRESGASLAWYYFFPNQPLPLLVRYIKDRDLWRFNEMHSESINAFIQSWPMDIENYDMLHHMFEHDLGFERALQGGVSINRYKQTMVEAICKTAAGNTAYPFYDGHIPIVNTSMLFSEVGNQLCKQFPDAPFAAYYYDKPADNIRQWGLRSIGDFDVSEVAKRYGGGGHKNAAGFEQKLNEL